MEVMDTSLDKFYKDIYKSGKVIPEEVLGKIAVAVSLESRWRIITNLIGLINKLIN